MTPTCVQICSTSDSRWVESSTVTPSTGQVGDQRSHLAGALRVQAVGRFVEDQQLPRLQQSRSDAQPLPHAQRVVAVALGGGRAADRPGRVRRRSATGAGRRVGRAVGCVQPAQVVPAGQVGVECGPLDQRPDRR